MDADETKSLRRASAFETFGGGYDTSKLHIIHHIYILKEGGQ